MKRILTIVVVSLFVFGCAKQTETGESYGEKITLTEQTDISAILANPEEFVGKRVLVSGEVVDVCEMKGCWIDIASDSAGGKIKVKVEDDVIVFPQTAKGKTAMVEGEVEVLTMTREELIAHKKHHAEEIGEDFDESTVTAGKTVYRIRGIGAVIKSE